jgi:hypothetical protein
VLRQTFIIINNAQIALKLLRDRLALHLGYLYIVFCSNMLLDLDRLLKINNFVIMFIDSAILRSLLRFLLLCSYTRGLV